LALALVLCLLGYVVTLQLYGFYDIWDGIRYLSGGISLIIDGLGSPVPIIYRSDLTPADFAEPPVLSYASIPYQLWAALTAGIHEPAIIRIVTAQAAVYALAGLYIYLLARSFVRTAAALFALGVLCAGLVIGDLYSKTM